LYIWVLIQQPNGQLQMMVVVVAGIVVVVEYYWFELIRKVNLWQTNLNQNHTDPSNEMEDEIFGYTEK
jgi:hypothetical protein